ncbi:MAG: phage terminase large subunit [Treponema sp.]|jgi:hypothetical protein|nr:phage terminase large subunit [Treponema sp.]
MFHLTEKQKELYRLIPTATTVLAEGGGRSGKTIALIRWIFLRAVKYPHSDHLVGRLRFAHAKQAVCYQTVPKLAEIEGINYNHYLNRSDWFYRLENDSRIWIGGFDDKERMEKILGNEYATVFLNEASQISYETRETILTRLNPPRGVAGKELIDYNPPSINHWGYQVFHKRVFPDGRPVPEDDYKWIKMNPCDNPYASGQYLTILANMSAAKRRRFLEGEYSTDSGALWKRAWISYAAGPARFDRVVVGVDPSGTVGGDEIGVVVAGRTGSDFHVLDDYSLHGTPAQWAAAVAGAYDKWRADAVVAERNYGGDMVESTIRAGRVDIKVTLVTATRGKVLRAEPVSTLYERGLVKHRMPLLDLEDEMCVYEGAAAQKSPNRLDALVFALADLAVGTAGTIGEENIAFFHRRF